MGSGELDCPNCGALLLKRITERGVTPADGNTEIPFRRTTDHVLCNACVSSYPVRELAERARSLAAEAAEAAERAGTAEPPDDDEQGADVITILERLAQRGSR